MDKDFDRWNSRKRLLHESDKKQRSLYYYEREIWWCAVGINLGVEIDGKNYHFERPVMILRKFNKDMFWGIPLTSQEHSGYFYEKVTHASSVSWAILSQLRTWSSKRLIRKLGIATRENFDRIHRKIRALA